MESYLQISFLNDFIFCPYSIYLHNVYYNIDEENFHEEAQQQGKNAHYNIDNNIYSTKKSDIVGIEVYSQEFGLMGKIDIYKKEEKKLIERKNQIKNIYQGQIYQLYAQYFCMTEMGFEINTILFYSMLDNKTHFIDLPTKEKKEEFRQFILQIKNYDITQNFEINENKCIYCVYKFLCDKTTINNA